MESDNWRVNKGPLFSWLVSVLRVLDGASEGSVLLEDFLFIAETDSSAEAWDLQVMLLSGATTVRDFAVGPSGMFAIFLVSEDSIVRLDTPPIKCRRFKFLLALVCLETRIFNIRLILVKDRIQG